MVESLGAGTGPVSIVASDVVTLADDGEIFPLLGIGTPDLGGDTLIPSATMAQSTGPGDFEIFESRDPSRTGATVKYAIGWYDSEGDYALHLRNESGQELTLGWSVFRVSV